MKEPAIHEVEARKFLLGQLSPEERGKIEELAFEDPETFTLIESVEEDLIDEFLHNELSPLERQRFKDYFMSFPGRRQDLEISQALQEQMDREVVAPGPEEVVPDDNDRPSFFDRFLDSLKAPGFWMRTITAAVLFALLIIAVWLVLRQKETQPDPIQAGPGTPVTVPSPAPEISPSLIPSPSPVQAENKRKSPTPEKQKPVVTYGTLLMPSAQSRSGGGPQLQLPPDASSVSVGLALTERKTYKTYDVTLFNEAGTKIDHWPNLEEQRLAATGSFPETRGLLIEVKTASLKPDESYRIEVTGVSANGERIGLQGYPFQAKN